jgi:hypothetical protein
MSDIFKRTAGNAKPFIVFAWPLGVLLVGLSLILMLEDYATSRAGYLALPTQKVNSDWVTFAVAALPQVGQIVLFYIFGRDTRRGWAALLASSFFVTDLATDAWFKSGGEWSLMPLAAVESLFIFTLGSEMLFTIAVGFVAEAFPDFIVSLGFTTMSIKDAFASAMEACGITEGRDKQEQQQQKRF